MSNILDTISKIGIVPVIAIDKVEDAKPLAKALCDGGLPCAEVTFRTEAAAEAIKVMATEFPEMVVGAGTVLTTDQVDEAWEAGAKFIVSPGLNPKIVKYCVEKNIPIVPGCANPSDIEQAIEQGLKTVKFFPAEAAGGLNMLKAMSAPYNKMTFMPTGGINAKNIVEYLSFAPIIACGGSWMVDKAMINAKEFDKITELTKEAVKTMLGFEMKHVGINMPSEEEADKVASDFESLFGFHKKVGNSSIFAGSEVEVMKTPYLGANGHIAIATNFIERAMYHLEQKGYVFDMETAKYDAKGKLAAVYLKDEFGGFAIHLLQK
ncbi:bifunctional 4-hydroxy-2-oxoglutarate aldolase/2-dehydro-3-deoxy-phosphogluconate aldolase [Anaeromicropila populeti]|uniref:2-dehydro-3-deoxy-phosphogluconate aldolase n=1 Tax=Anaeromicropila populeti TaxID=37658 RepID=A0A1I6I9A4_9FIRM|nr:bifunctional 4-hydroxy-2-oxoglutarate aldolase/2-dehydro-3-deoxy-phosphogluconate aldolase [Anaeromicropila populeti]SFR63228.1 2-dehydro-3-deoxyphosphogluconate aldolase / (4S)-4-hydroxy-2-oxoglutarate aldolase [Anaeromicropila populeti]